MADAEDTLLELLRQINPGKAYECKSCGHKTRIITDVTIRLTGTFHYTIGGLLQEVLDQQANTQVNSRKCLWCGDGGRIEEVDATEVEPQAP